jgi:hypothetical protein
MLDFMDALWDIGTISWRIGFQRRYEIKHLQFAEILDY